mgnify:CR=1 FL=1
MESLSTGNTPFEKAAVGRAKAQLFFTVHQAVKDLLEELEECDSMISKWKDTVRAYAAGKATKDDLEADLQLATAALKDKQLFEAAIVKITETAAQELGMEA